MRKNLFGRKTIVTATIAAVALVGGGATALALTPTATTPRSTESTAQTMGQPTIEAPPEAREPWVDTRTEQEQDAAERAEDAAEQAALVELATVDPAAAADAAIAAVPGTASPATLEEERGYVVYEVDVTKDDGSVVEVLVDAGNAAVLGQEADDDGNDDGDDGDDGDDD